MAARSQGRQKTTKRQTTYRKSAYVQGTAVKRLDVTKEIEAAPRKRLSHATRKNRDKARHMNLGYVLFLVTALSAAGFMLVGYIELQFDITNSVKTISQLESQLNSMRLENDEELNRVESAVDLEEIKRIAIEELGMSYARDGQVIAYSSEGSDYVRQVADIPDK